MCTLNYASALSYKRKTWFEYAVGRNQKIVVVLLLLGTTPKILNWCYFDHVAIFICLHHCHYGIHSLNWELDGYILAKIVATSTEVICFFAEVLWGFISSESYLKRRSILTVANKNTPIKAHKVSSFMRFNKILRNLTIVFTFGMYLRRSHTKVALVPSGTKIFKMRSLIGNFQFNTSFIKILFCVFALLFFIDQNTWK